MHVCAQVFAVGEEGAMVRSLDSGRTWGSQAFQAGDGIALYAIARFQTSIHSPPGAFHILQSR